MEAFILFIFLRAAGSYYTVETADFDSEQQCQAAVQAVKKTAHFNLVDTYCIKKG